MHHMYNILRPMILGSSICLQDFFWDVFVLSYLLETMHFILLNITENQKAIAGLFERW